MDSIISSILLEHFKKKKKDFPKISTRWLAEKLSVSQVYVSQILNGKRSLPPHLVDSICTLLDIDSEKKEIISNQILQQQGWQQAPSKGLRTNPVENVAHGKEWEQVPLKDFELLDSLDYFLVLEATQLKDFDGTAGFIARKLGLEEQKTRMILQRLDELGYLRSVENKAVKASSLMEMQSKTHKSALVANHSRIFDGAKSIMIENIAPEDIEARFIGSSIFTCSKENIPFYRARIAEFLKDLSSQAAQDEAEEIYCFGLAFYPVAPSSNS